MQGIDLNAELERAHKSLREAKSEDVAKLVVGLIENLYGVAFWQEIKFNPMPESALSDAFIKIKEEEAKSTAQVINEIKDEKKEIDWVKELMVFLVTTNSSCDAFEKWREATEKHHGTDWKKVLKGERMTPFNYINGTFSWPFDEVSFWSKLNRDWLDQVKRIKWAQND